MYRNVRLAKPLPRPGGSRGRSVIAVTGIDHYAGWPRLHNAVNDAQGAARMFAQLGFAEVTRPLLDGAATGQAMHRLVTTDLAELAADDSLVVFFAGHGHTETAVFDDVAVKTGYLIPADGQNSGGGGKATWLRLDSWLSDIARLPPRHILVMVDACHSGVALSALHKWRHDAVAGVGLEALQARRSRCVITSALDDQRAMDGGPHPGHSLFTGCLIEGLSGGLGDGGRRVATGRELGEYLQRRVRSYPHTAQTPDFGAFELDDRGDIVVPLLGSETAPDTPASPRGRHASTGRAAKRLLATAPGPAGIASAIILLGSAALGGESTAQTPEPPAARAVSFELPAIEIRGAVYEPQALLEPWVPRVELPSWTVDDALLKEQRALIERTTDPARKRAQATVLSALLYVQGRSNTAVLVEARRVARNIIQQAGDHADADTAWRLLGACDVLLEDYPAAEQTWQTLVDRNPNDRDAPYCRAWLAYAQLRQRKLAAALATVAGQPLDVSSELAYVTAWARWRSGDSAGAWQAIAAASKQWNDAVRPDVRGGRSCLLQRDYASDIAMKGEVLRFAGQANIAPEHAAPVMKALVDGYGYPPLYRSIYGDLGLRGYGPTGRWAHGLTALDQAVEVSNGVMESRPPDMTVEVLDEDIPG